MKLFHALLCLFAGGTLAAQIPFSIYCTPKVDGMHFALNEIVTDNNGVKISIDHFNYYISNVHLVHDGGQDLDLSDTVFLVKQGDFRLDLGSLPVTQVEKIRFGVGVSVELSHTDISLYPENHPLTYQSPSMHWGWAAGYMHMIVGGSADSDNNDVPDAYFELHNLGDNNYYQVELDVTDTDEGASKAIYIDCNLDTWLGLTDLATNGIKHGEDGVNFTVMKNVILRPVFTASGNAGTDDIETTQGQLSFFRKEGGNYVSWSDLGKPESFSLIDLNGKVLMQQNVSGPSGEFCLGERKPGSYFVRFYDTNQRIIGQLKMVL